MHVLDSDEKVVLAVRKHWFVIATKITFLSVMAILPIVVAVLGGMFNINLGDYIEGNAYALFMFAYALWLLLLWVVFFFQWTDFYLDVWYVTNKRVIDVEQKGLFNREVATLYYENIRDITTRTRGVLATLLKFGDIHMQTSGENREFIMHSAAHPEEARELILDQYRAVVESVKEVKIHDPKPPQSTSSSS